MDEYLYQKLRSSFVKCLQQQTGFDSVVDVALRVLPDALPSGEDSPEEWEYGLQPGLFELQAALMRLCVQEDVEPFDPGADLLFVTYDEAIEALAEKSRFYVRRFEERYLSPEVQKPVHSEGT